jgi:hypothetical protein
MWVSEAHVFINLPTAHTSDWVVYLYGALEGDAISVF